MFILEVWSTRKSYSSELFETQDEAAQALTYARGAEDFRKGSITVVTDPADLEPFARRAKRHAKPHDMTPSDFDATTKMPQHPTLDMTRQAPTRLPATPLADLHRSHVRGKYLKDSPFSCGRDQALQAAISAQTPSTQSAGLKWSRSETYRHYTRLRKAN